MQIMTSEVKQPVNYLQQSGESNDESWSRLYVQIFLKLYHHSLFIDSTYPQFSNQRSPPDSNMYGGLSESAESGLGGERSSFSFSEKSIRVAFVRYLMIDHQHLKLCVYFIIY